MTQETGRVVGKDKLAVWVETVSRGSCQNCSLKSGCGHGILNQLGSGRCHHIRVLLGDIDPADVDIGDRVEIAIPDRVLVGGALLVYLTPLISLLVGAILASRGLAAWIPDADVASFVGALSGFALGLIVVKCHSLLHYQRPGYQPVLVAVNRSDTGVADPLHVSN